MIKEYLAGEEDVCELDDVTYKSDNEVLSDQLHMGKLMLTNYRLWFFENSGQKTIKTASLCKFHVPLGCINSICEGRRDKSMLTLDIQCKDIRAFRFALKNASSAAFIEQLREHADPNAHNRQLFAYTHGRAWTGDRGWDVYNPELEYQRLNVEANNWRLTQLNRDYTLCPSYPALLAVPRGMADSALAECASKRTSSRLPVLSWLHPASKASLTRSSQPRMISSADRLMLTQIQSANANINNLFIFDARSPKNAYANYLRGGGVEKHHNYDFVQYIFLNIHNIHSMRSSYHALQDACLPAPSDARWLKQLEETKWLYYLKLILFAATSVADKIENHKASVLVHCSDGWDRTSQITSLAMLMLDPYYRTLRGFQVLVEKEWVSFGHKFALRTGGPAAAGDLVDAQGQRLAAPEWELERCEPAADQRSPVFLQFVDCVWQMTDQFPAAFEFNGRFLRDLLDEVYAARFGTFLFNNEREAQAYRSREFTVSVWSKFNDQPDAYRNPMYVSAELSGDRVIFPQHALSQLKFWSAYYLRWHAAVQAQDPETRRHQLLCRMMEAFRQGLALSQQPPPLPHAAAAEEERKDDRPLRAPLAGPFINA